MKKIRLPKGKVSDHPGVAILQALHDLAACERSKRYKINMCDWHSGAGGFGPKCEVCFAGAVMAKTLKCDLSSDHSPWDGHFDDDASNKLVGLDHAREGEWCDFLFSFKVPVEMRGALRDMLWDKFKDHPDYDYDKRAFKIRMRSVALLLLRHLKLSKGVFSLRGLKTSDISA